MCVKEFLMLKDCYLVMRFTIRIRTRADIVSSVRLGRKAEPIAALTSI